MPQADIGKPDVGQGLQPVFNGRYIRKKFQGFLHGHGQDVGNIFGAVFYLQSFTVIPAALAGIAGDKDIRQEMHGNLDDPVAFAGLTASPFEIKAEPPNPAAIRPATGSLAEALQNAPEDPDFDLETWTRQWEAVEAEMKAKSEEFREQGSELYHKV